MRLIGIKRPGEEFVMVRLAIPALPVMHANKASPLHPVMLA